MYDNKFFTFFEGQVQDLFYISVGYDKLFCLHLSKKVGLENLTKNYVA